MVRDTQNQVSNRLNLDAGMVWLPLALLGGLTVVAWLLSQFFFNSDSIYYLARRIDTLSEFSSTLLRLDDRGNFRPFTYWVASGLLIPLGQLNVAAYRTMAVLFHGVNIILAFLLIRQLTFRTRLAILTSFFFGLHFVVFNVSYGLVCLPDLSYVFFALLACLFFLKFLATREALWEVCSLCAFVFALLCKETAVVIPVSISALALIHGRNQRKGKNRRQNGMALFKPTIKFWIVLVLYLAYFSYLSGGFPIPAEPRHPYATSFTADTLLMRSPYLLWVCNLPIYSLHRMDPSPVWQRLMQEISLRDARIWAQTTFQIAPYLKLGAIIIWLPFLVWGLWRTYRSPQIRLMIPLSLALFSSLLPVLFLTHKMMPHNVYLASLGFAFWMALCLSNGACQDLSTESASLKSRRIAFVAAAYLLLTSISVINEVRRSWLTHASLMAREAVFDLEKQLPGLPPDSTLFFLKSDDSGLPWYYDGGNLFRVWFKKPQLKVLFADRGDILPETASADSHFFVLRPEGTHLINVTEDYISPVELSHQDLTSFFDLQKLQMDRAEYYPNYDRFDTPNGKAVTRRMFHRFGESRKALILLGGASLTAEMPAMQEPLLVHLSASLALDSGDGVVASLWAGQGEELSKVWEKDLFPARNWRAGKWVHATVDLSAYGGRPFKMKLQCSNRPGRHTVGDWVAWGLTRPMPVRIPVETAAGQPAAPAGR